MDAALTGPVPAMVFDHEGINDIAFLLESLSSADFETDEPERFLMLMNS